MMWMSLAETLQHLAIFPSIANHLPPSFRPIVHFILIRKSNSGKPAHPDDKAIRKRRCLPIGRRLSPFRLESRGEPLRVISS